MSFGLVIIIINVFLVKKNLRSITFSFFIFSICLSFSLSLLSLSRPLFLFFIRFSLFVYRSFYLFPLSPFFFPSLFLFLYPVPYTYLLSCFIISLSLSLSLSLSHSSMSKFIFVLSSFCLHLSFLYPLCVIMSLFCLQSL